MGNLDETLVTIERFIWEKALENVKCILPDDAEDVKQEAARLRKELTEKIQHEGVIF